MNQSIDTFKIIVLGLFNTLAMLIEKCTHFELFEVVIIRVIGYELI